VQQAALFQEMAVADGVDADTKLLAVDSAATFHEVADGTARVTILGNTVAMPEAAAAALRSASTEVLGTRFVATFEANAHPLYVDALLKDGRYFSM
jgi:hypothetical protein